MRCAAGGVSLGRIGSLPGRDAVHLDEDAISLGDHFEHKPFVRGGLGLARADGSASAGVGSHGQSAGGKVFRIHLIDDVREETGPDERLERAGRRVDVGIGAVRAR